MITDRYLQIFAIILLFLRFKGKLLSGFFSASILGFFLLLLVVIGLLVWQSLYQAFGPKKLRSLVGLRWELGNDKGPFQKRRKAKASSAVLRAYDIDPSAALPEQEQRLRDIVRDAHAVNKRVPPVFQSPLTAAGLGQFLAEFSDLTETKRRNFIDALVEVEPEERQLGLRRRLTLAVRHGLGPLVASKEQRRRISFVYAAAILEKRFGLSPRLSSLVKAVTVAREAEGLSPFEGGFSDVIADLPLAVQRDLVLMSELAFGNLDLKRARFTDPSKLKWLRTLKVHFDKFRAPSPSLWDISNNAEAQRAAAKTAKAAQPEPTGEELLAEVQSEALDAIYLRRAWPIGSETEGRSWLGGAPLLPESMSWPKQASTQTPLHFLAQIDCAQLPSVANGPDLPEEGLLLFFAPIDEEMDWEDGAGEVGTLYVPESAVPDVEAPFPKDLPDLDHAEGEMSGGRARIGVRSYPKWPLSAHQVKSFSADHATPAGKAELVQQRQQAALLAHLPAPQDTPRRSIMERGYLKDSQPTTADLPSREKREWQRFVSPELCKIGFPFCGAVMSRFSVELEGSLLSEIEREKSFKSYLVAKGDSEQIDRVDAKITVLATQLTHVMAATKRLNSIADLDVPDSDTRDWFVTWLNDLETNRGLGVSAELGRAMMSVAQQSVIDPKMRAALPAGIFEFFDSSLRPTLNQSEHMMLGHTQFKTNETSDSGVRLLVLDSDYGVDFMFCDCGMVEFWIDEDDLKAQDFSGVRGHTAGG